jgi:hypothetical protein
MKKMTTWKICNNGHRYSGSGPCPVCWSGHGKKAEKKR